MQTFDGLGCWMKLQVACMTASQLTSP